MPWPKLRASHSLLPLLLGFTLLTACRPAETRVAHGNRNGILHLNNGTEPSDLDPHVVTGVPEHHICMALFEGLVAEDPKDLHPVPGAAERWEISPDGTVYTFYLHKNGKWSNGDPVTATDFHRSYERILTPKLASEYAYMHHVVKNAEEYNKGTLKDFSQVGYKVIDPHTFEITLKSPTPYFLALISHTSWYPVHIPTVEKHGSIYSRTNRWTRPGHLVGNGSFSLKEWKLNSFIRTVKNPHYWDREIVRLNEIYFYPVENSNADERAFKVGQVHKCYEVPALKIASYKKENPHLLRIDPLLSTYFYRLNVTKPPLNNIKVRKALSMAINRQDIVDYVTRGGQIPALHFTPPNTGGYNTKARIEQDFEKAKKMLAEAGYPNGAGFPKIEILFNTLESHRAIAEAIQQMWKKNLNIDVTLVNQEFKVYLTTMQRLDYQVARAGWNGDYADPNNFLDMFLTDGGNNETGWSNPKYDALIKQGGMTTDPEKRMELLQEAEAILLEELPILPIYFYTRPFLISPSVQGWYPTILDLHPYKHVWLDPTASADHRGGSR